MPPGALPSVAQHGGQLGNGQHRKECRRQPDRPLCRLRQGLDGVGAMFDFKNPLRHWSLWLSGAGTAVLGLALILPEIALQLWTDVVPDELKALLPPEMGL